MDAMSDAVSHPLTLGLLPPRQVYTEYCISIMSGKRLSRYRIVGCLTVAVLWLTMQVDNAAVIIYGVSLAYKESGMKSHLFVCLYACWFCRGLSVLFLAHSLSTGST